MSEEKIYQPGWEERREREQKRRNHYDDYDYVYAQSRHTGKQESHTNSWGGWMRLRDKQAYYGLMFIVLCVLGFGLYTLVMMFVNEWRAMPHDDPTTEMSVDELRIHKADEQDALLHGDSLAQAYQFDSSQIKKVQIETRSVYRPPRRENEWYITQREWKDIWRNIKRWRQSRRNDEKVKEKE
jgi:hypothetical protein